ncbi:MAG TPA: zinc ribbon domain-containing protein [Thauera sp.]|nr:zinc ribbon domain-containing protein [Thauera sp.]HRA80184.1 zinc ribbon domain-containing protein [Thauera sp.]
MPIYEYRCPSCSFQKEHLQKMSDEPLSTCPSCGATGYTKLLSAAGFQLKGSGWYATDFKGGGTAASGAAAAAPASTDSSSAASPGCAGGCACH